MIHVDPNLPKQWKKLELNVQFRSNHYVISIESEKVSVLLTAAENDQVQGCVNNVMVELKKGIPCLVS